MFDKFGKMSYDELIRTAKAEKEEGDEEALIALAQENGLDQEDAEDYMDDLTEVLCTPREAAVARVEMEAKDLEVSGIWEEWKGCVLEMCMQEEDLACAVCRKNRSLLGLFGKLLKLGFDSKQRVDKRICKEAGLNDNVYTGIPTRQQVAETISNYYNKD
ncbi:Uncharacterised protein [uncultured Clostridium sp.]|uniref:Uncharacterized protein n=1 Tax=Muricoprocola aceti TaxID=2981772 RepID=A0ABT2SMM3_9FIRM|nr:hypothetical protein [Muricoprocola aceti]MCU6725749.1 hypothetical protein [Muricoprocola aceti]SCH63384.1 Uncharacterised protein [uncultured Clostridium sp.]